MINILDFIGILFVYGIGLFVVMELSLWVADYTFEKAMKMIDKVHK